MCNVVIFSQIALIIDVLYKLDIALITICGFPALICPIDVISVVRIIQVRVL
jgi:hypothetical protein